MRDFSLMVIALALVTQQCVSAWDRVQQRHALRDRLAAQAPLLEDTQAVREQLRGLLLETRALAQSGNSNASALVASLERQGVRFTGSAEQ